LATRLRVVFRAVVFLAVAFLAAGATVSSLFLLTHGGARGPWTSNDASAPPCCTRCA
jgi:hypothetical protein